MAAVKKKKPFLKRFSVKLSWAGQLWHKIRSLRWWKRWPIYILLFILVFQSISWVVDELSPKVKDPQYGVSFSIKYAEELGNDWQANYLALLNDLHFKHLRLMSYWDQIEPGQNQYDFKDLDWQVDEASKSGAKVSLVIGFRQPRYPECHEPGWAAKMPIESQQWRTSLYDYLKTTVNRYKNNSAIESYQLENESKNNWFGSCRGSAAPDDRLNAEFNLVKKADTGHPVLMSLSDEHGLPIGTPVPDEYGFSIYQIVYSTNTPIHFYATYPITIWYHRLRVFYINHFKHRQVFIHELQLEPWGPRATKDMTIAEQNRSMSVAQMHKNITYARKTGIKDMYMWGGEWWYWRKTHLNDPGPWNAIKQEVNSIQNSSY